VAARCQPCFRHHLSKAKELGIASEDILEAIRRAAKIGEVGGQRMIDFVDATMKEQEEQR
jgi:alkylhydroperoxidase/carboxymuconolactone decarboxylase family protein YurZ